MSSRVCALMVLLALVCGPMVCAASDADVRVGPEGTVAMDDEGSPDVPAVTEERVGYPSQTFNDTVVLLQEFHNAMINPLSVNWKFPVNTTYCDDWQGIACADPTHKDAITSLTLSGTSLGGTIPGTLGTVLTLLQKLDLSENPNLHGTLAQEVFGATDFINLVELRIANTDVSGIIPDLTQHENLSVLDLSRNKLSGPVPDEILQLASLSELRLSYNELTHDLPDRFATGIELHSLDLQHNQLTGKFPDSLFGATGLTLLLMNNNNFTGALPTNPPAGLVAESSVKDNEWACDIPTLWLPFAGPDCVTPPDPINTPSPTPSPEPSASPSQLPLKRAGHGAAFISGMVILSLVIACGVVYAYWRYRRRFAGFETM